MPRVDTYAELPEVVNGFEQDRYDIRFVRPMTATNLIRNPSFETNTTGWSAYTGATLARVITEQRFGSYALSVTPTIATDDGAFASGYITTTGVMYFVSAWVKGVPGIPYRLWFGTSNNPKNFTGTGKWERILHVYTETAGGSRSVVIQKNGSADTTPFYIDGAQLELNRFTSYFDGSLRGFIKNQAAYYWTGAEHASTSVRISATRSGGEEISLSDYGFKVLAILGLGGDNLSNIIVDNAFLGGGTYEGTIYTPSTFDIVGTFTGSLADIMRNKSDLRRVLSPDAGIIHQPLVMKIRVKNECGDYISEPMEVECLFNQGLPGVRDNYSQERASLSFTISTPHTGHLDGTIAVAVPTSESRQLVYDVAFSRRNAQTGEWTRHGGAATGGAILDAVYLNGRLYVAGSFTGLGGVANTDYVGYYDFSDSAWHAMGTGVSAGSNAYALAARPDGKIIVIGPFTEMGGVANTSHAALYDPATNTWSSVGNLLGTTFFYDVKVGPNGTMYASTDGAGLVYSNTGSSWVSLAHPGGNGVLAIDKEGVLYTADAGGAGDVMKYQSAAWTVVVAHNNPIRSLVVGLDGALYVAGSFTTIGGISANYVAKIVGNLAYPLSSGFSTTTTTSLQAAAIDPTNGDYYVVQESGTVFGGKELSSRVGIWNGFVWIPPDLPLPYSEFIAFAPNGDLFIPTNANVAPGRVTVDSQGTKDSFPTIRFFHQGTFNQLRNYTNGAKLFFDLTLNNGEIATLDFSGPSITFKSNFRPNLLGTILPGSTLAEFTLSPGDNIIGLSAWTYTALEANDGSNQLSNYRFYGQSAENTDGGVLYASILFDGFDFYVVFYKNSARTLAVAMTDPPVSGVSTDHNIIELNDSGLTGLVDMNLVALDSDITVTIPIMTMEWEPNYAALEDSLYRV